MGKKLLKNLLFIMTMVMLCFAIVTTANAEEVYTYGDYIYQLNTIHNDGTAIVTDYTGNEDEITIPSEVDGIKVTGVAGFYGNPRIKKVIIPEGVTFLGQGTFERSFYLTEVCFPKTMESMFTEPDALEFWICYSLKSYTVDDENPYFSSDEYGVLFNKDKTELIRYPLGLDLKTYTVPSTVEKIRPYSFRGSYYLEEVILPEGLKDIGEAAFGNCFKLKTVTIPTASSVGAYAFIGCESLEEITIENVENIGEAAFADCHLLEKIYVKSMTSSIGEFSLGIKTCEYLDGMTLSKLNELMLRWYDASYLGNEEAAAEYLALHQDAEDKIIDLDEPAACGTIYCHAGSTAESYAIGSGADFELVHFFGEWVYDWDNFIRTRKCDLCEYTETESLEKNGNGDVEIIGPEDTDTDFEIEEVEKNGDNYILIEEAVKNNTDGDFSILKTFDITLKNSDGVHVQPSGTVKVKLPLDWEKDGNYKVYRVNDDGTLTDMNAYRQGSHMVFETDHFSIYVIVEVDVQQEPEEPSTEEKSPFDFLNKVINWFKKLLAQITEFFRSIGNRT